MYRLSSTNGARTNRTESKYWVVCKVELSSFSLVRNLKMSLNNYTVNTSEWSWISRFGLAWPRVSLCDHNTSGFLCLSCRHSSKLSMNTSASTARGFNRNSGIQITSMNRNLRDENVEKVLRFDEQRAHVGTQHRRIRHLIWREALRSAVPTDTNAFSGWNGRSPV